jgi:uncharacterized protein (DUF486 family)
MQAIRSAWQRVKGRLFVSLWLGNLLLLLLAAGWLQIPDSHAWQFAFSMLSGVLLVVVFLWLYVASFRHLRSCSRSPWWLSCLLLAGGVALFWVLLQVPGAGRAHEALFAGYWNSQSPASLRGHVGYSALVAWQEHIYDGVEYLLAGLLLPLLVELCACGWQAGCFSRAARVYRHWLYWLCVLVFGFAASAVTWALADWTPATGLATQTFSLIARLGIAYTFDILLWTLLLGLIGHYLDSEV